MKKVIALFSTVLICFSVLSSNLLTVSAQCNDNSAEYEYSFDLNSLENSDLTETQILEQKNLLTDALRIVIKNIIKHPKKIAKFIEQVSGKKVAKWFLKYHAGISASLEPLLKYSDLPKDAVVDAVYRGIINAGGSSQIASNVSLAIKTVWDLFLF